MVAGLKHPESVRIIGQVDSIHDVLDQVDALIVPSDKPEPFGLVAIEAFARGRAVIGSDGGGLSDIIDDGVNGRRFKRGDVAELAHILQNADRTTSLASQGQRGLGKFVSKYSAEAFASRMAEVWS